MKFILLTHQRELERPSNTGSLVATVLKENSEVIVWERTKPSAVLLDYIASGAAALLYPSNESALIAASDSYQYYIIIDGTWQEANKIYNKSAYLHNTPIVKVSAMQASEYNLRRNQRLGCLCTAETAIEALTIRGITNAATELRLAFQRHID